MSYENITFEITDGVAELTLNRPKALNSFTAAMHQEVAAALSNVDGVRCLLLTGAGRGFCAGQDLSDRDPDGEPVDLGYTLETYYNPLVRRLRALPMPVVCAVNGVAAGAGANLALACDIVLAARSAKFIQAFAKIGLLPDSGGTWVLPRLIGTARATALALTADPVSAEQAEQWGMIYRVINDGELMAESRELCAHFATQPTLGLTAIKQAMQVGLNNDLDTQLDLERDEQRRLGQSQDYREGVAAFLAKRKPVFKGQ